MKSIFILLFIFAFCHFNSFAGRCYGNANCTACTTCNGCQLCNEGGGECGVCGGGRSSQSYSERNYSSNDDFSADSANNQGSNTIWWVLGVFGVIVAIRFYFWKD